MTLSITMISAQTVLDQGYIKMEITDVSSDNEQTAMMAEMLKGTSTEIYFNGEKSLSRMSMMGGMVETTTLLDNTTENMEMLINAMGQKMHVVSTAEERNAGAGEQAAMMKDMKVTYDESDTKEIMGYKCMKANISHPEMDGMSFSMYITKDIKANSKMMQALETFELDGFPLEYIMDTQVMKLTISAIDIKAELEANAFDIDTGGYLKLTFKEFQEKMAAFGGGMGF